MFCNIKNILIKINSANQEPLPFFCINLLDSIRRYYLMYLMALFLVEIHYCFKTFFLYRHTMKYGHIFVQFLFQFQSSSSLSPLWLGRVAARTRHGGSSSQELTKQTQIRKQRELQTLPAATYFRQQGHTPNASSHRATN